MTSMNCNHDIQEDIKNNVKELKELSEKSRLLLEKGPAIKMILKEFACGWVF